MMAREEPTSLLRDLALAAVLAVMATPILQGCGGGSATPPMRSADEETTVILAAATEQGPAAAMALLEGRAGRNAELASRGHDIAHQVGRLAVAGAGHDPAVISGCSPAFKSGCYHGVVQGFLEHRGGISAEAVREICNALRSGTQSQLPALECAHGVGHGLNVVLGHDVPAALGWCDALDGEAREWCYGGVFMENLANAAAERTGPSPDHHGTHAGGPHVDAGPDHRHLRAEDPFYPCSALDPPYLRACWQYQNVVFLLHSDNDFRVAADLCTRAPAESVNDCFEGLGIQATGLFGTKPERVREICELGLRDAERACIVGAADYMFGVGWSEEGAFRFCSRAPEHARDGCYARIGFRIAQAEPDESARAVRCRTARGAGQSACRLGAGIGGRS